MWFKSHCIISQLLFCHSMRLRSHFSELWICLASPCQADNHLRNQWINKHHLKCFFTRHCFSSSCCLIAALLSRVTALHLFKILLFFFKCISSATSRSYWANPIAADPHSAGVVWRGGLEFGHKHWLLEMLWSRLWKHVGHQCPCKQPGLKQKGGSSDSGDIYCWCTTVGGLEVKTTGWGVWAEVVDYPWGLWPTHWGMFFPLGQPFCFLIGYNSDRMTKGGSYRVAEGTVLLAGCIWKLMWETVLHRLWHPRKPLDGVSVWFPGKALHGWNSSDGPIHRKSWLLPLQCTGDSTFEKALGDSFFPPPLHMCQELLGASFVFVGGMWNSIFQETSEIFYEV